ncbi:Ribosomal RNA small subunit methyltransferase D [Enhygromyxa salina]|uniref:Ribosomal RNA small subunit methyltransferase D n=1 Tax=Enhygromyxa salina TaxID=215803 RepID=A0A2S9YYT3_9BACT|nr:Ribosomal RNA small subunit methyltransferase D [Enhygromyxa salina]
MRSAIFDRLQREVVGARVLDLFAGTGALAIEALSRGAAHAILVEQQPQLSRFLTRQLDTLGISGRARVIQADARELLGDRGGRAGGRAAGLGPGRFDLVLVDPPYEQLDLYAAVLDALVTHEHLADDAVIVIEYQKHRGRSPQIPFPASLHSEAVRDHGQTALEFLRHVPSQTSLP